MVTDGDYTTFLLYVSCASLQTPTKLSTHPHIEACTRELTRAMQHAMQLDAMRWDAMRRDAAILLWSVSTVWHFALYNSHWNPSMKQFFIPLFMKAGFHPRLFLFHAIKRVFFVCRITSHRPMSLLQVVSCLLQLRAARKCRCQVTVHVS